ncbi:hypothetical protein BBUWI9123_J0049 (plasmid) [Borreliella burgdorferi WI91-23]|nr:hypothetical protein BBUWI9123_J0049 [Borreliella burgdorferi WI91-23]
MFFRFLEFLLRFVFFRLLEVVGFFSSFGLTLPKGAHDMQIEVNIAVITLSLIIFNLRFFKMFSL